MKWVPGTTRLSRPEILKKTVNYIKKIQNKEKEIEKAEKTTKYIEELEKKINELEKELLKKKVNYIEELQKKIKELETSQTPPREPYPSEPSLDPTSTMDVRTTSPTAEEELPEEELLAEFNSELLASGECTEEELLANLEEELLANEEELPELKSMEEMRRWLEL
jgi:recombinational DNA repair ATPase RecF